MENEDIDPVRPGEQPHRHNFVGQIVRFFLRRKGGAVTEEKGEVAAQQWLGFTQRGNIPEYEVKIIGKTGRSVFARVTRDHVVPI